jgi:hypothetical protein
VRGSGVRGIAERPSDYFEHAIGVSGDVVIPETQDKIACLFKFRRARQVGSGFGMLAAIKLDHDASLLARKIGDVAPIGNWRRNLKPSRRRARR